MTDEQKDYYDRWFSRVQREFCPLFNPYVGKPVVYVEIGCWAGASAEWVSRNVLTHSASQGFGIDPYTAERRHPAEEIETIKSFAALRLSVAIGQRWTWLYHPSEKALAATNVWLGPKLIDILYIDGDHRANAVVLDFALAWPHLRPGALVIFDDYICGPKELPNVKAAYDSILICWRGLIEEVGQHRKQRAFRVLRKEHDPL